MIRFFLQRVIVSLFRLGGAVMVLLALMELFFCVIGASDRHVWMIQSYGPVPTELSATPTTWSALLQARGGATLLVLLIGYSGILLTGYSWGILGARWRKFRGTTLLGSIFSFIACIPGFWLVILISVYSYYRWERPGFANDIVVDEGPDLLSLWNACIVAVPAMVAGIAWQVRAVASDLEKEITAPYVRGLFVSGVTDDDIFYRHVLRRATPALLDRMDRTVPFFLGSLMIVEFAFRYEGIGSLLIESVRLENYGGILAGSVWMMVVISLIALVRECAVGFVQPDGLS